MRFNINIRSLALVFLLCFGNINSHSQSNFAIEVGTAGASLSIFGLGLEYNILNTPDAAPLQSIRVATGFGYGWSSNSRFLPIESRFVLFDGSSHLEIMLGINIQVKWESPDPRGFLTIGRSLLNPTACLGYRLDPPDGGFTIRYGIGTTYIVSDNIFIPLLSGGLGWSFQ